MNEHKIKTVFEDRDELQRNYDRVRAAFERQTIECNELRNQLAATEEALAQVQRESADLRTKAEAARKVGGAAVEWYSSRISVDRYPKALDALVDAVREYRALIEAPAPETNHSTAYQADAEPAPI